MTDMRPAITLTKAINDPQLLGGPFTAPSFWTWRVVAKLIDGLPLDEGREVELFKQCTGRTRLPDGPVRRGAILAGRRAGKDRFLSACAVWRAALAADWREHISAGEGAVCLLLGADRKQASILRRYCEGLLQTPLLKAEVVRRTDDVVEFRNGASLEVGTNNASLIRGRSAIAVLGSEASHWRTEEYAASSDEEVVGAAEPSLAMCPDGGLLLLGSSVHRKRGFMYRMYKKLHGNDDSEDICWFAPSTVMNPKLPTSVVERALEDDAPRARAEFLNVWREDVSDFIPIDVVEGCTDFGTYERAPQATRGVKYVAFCDAAGGTGRDSFTLAVAHREVSDPRRVVVLDLVREVKPRFVPSAVVAAFATILKEAYKVTEVQGDGFAGGFHADEWATHGIRFVPCENTTSENYLALLPLLLSPGRVRLCDSAVLRQQLAGLERRVHAGQQRESVSHHSTQSAHDDVAASAAGALVLAAMRSQYNLSHPGLYDDDAPAEPPRSRVPPGMSLEEYERITRPSSPFPLPREYVEAVQREEGLPVHVREGLQRARLDRLRRGGLP